MDTWDSDLMTVTELAQIMRIGKNKAYEVIKVKGFPSIRVGSTYLISKTAFKEWTKKNLGNHIELGEN